MKLLRLLVLLLVSLAVPAYGGSSLPQAPVCPMHGQAPQGEAPAASPAAQAHAVHAMACCVDPEASAPVCQDGQDCQPAATLMIPPADPAVGAVHAPGGVVAHAWPGAASHQPPALWRPPRHRCAR